MALLFVSQFLIGAGPLPYAMLLLATTSLGHRVRVRGAVAQHVRGRVLPGARGPGGAVPQRAAGAGHRARAGARGGVRRPRLLVGPAARRRRGPGAVCSLVQRGQLPLAVGRAGRRPRSAAASAIPAARFWVFAAFAVCYGVVETMNGNWATVYMTHDLGASATVASLALTAFWAMVTVGPDPVRRHRAPAPGDATAYRLLPFVAAVALAADRACCPRRHGRDGLAAFGLAGLGCSALLPLTISFGQRELAAIGASSAGLLIAFYQMGYGIAAFGVGPLQDAAGRQPVHDLRGAAVVAVAMGCSSCRAAPVAVPAGRERRDAPSEPARSQLTRIAQREDLDVAGEQGRHRHRRRQRDRPRDQPGAGAPGRRGHRSTTTRTRTPRTRRSRRSRPPAGKAQAVQGDVSSRRRHPEPRRRDRGRLRPARHHGQQRRHGDADLDARHDRAPVRPGHRDRPQERVLRRPAGGEADDQRRAAAAGSSTSRRSTRTGRCPATRRTARPRAASGC